MARQNETGPETISEYDSGSLMPGPCWPLRVIFIGGCYFLSVQDITMEYFPFFLYYNTLKHYPAPEMFFVLPLLMFHSLGN